jgi:serine/threonine protein kinase
MRQLKHKNIVQLLDFIETEEHYFIVLELVPGGELFHQIVRLTYFSEDLSRHVIIQVAEAIKYLHEEAGVVHRDIKPENLLFYPIPFTPSKKRVFRKGDDESEKQDEGLFIPGKGAGTIGTVKLADFGLSKIIWDQNTKTPCGTVGYTAPEIVNDQRYSKSVDMWALGCVLYTILCGFPPFYDESIQTLTEKVARGEFTFLSPWWDDISFEARDLVNKLLTIDPKRRYNIHQFLAHPWIQKGYEQINAAQMAAGDVPAPQQHNASLENSNTAFAGHTPGVAQGKAKAALNPASIAMREAFDVFSAVHRMKEENNNNGISELGTFAEEDEDEDVSAATLAVNKMEISGQSQQQQQQPPSRVPRRRQQQQRQQNVFFELNMDGATLLGRRKKAQVAAN